jgi:hypothetical protein
MLNIATPRLSAAEWRDVQATLNAVADCGCGDRPAPGRVRARIGHALDALLGPKKVPAATLSPHLRPVRDFLCETGRARRMAERHVPALAAQGFSRAQIEAMALLGA